MAADIGEPALSFDLSLVGQDYIVASASKRRAMQVLAGVMVGVEVVFAGSLFIFGIFAPGMGLARQLLALALGGAVVYLAVASTRLIFRTPWADVARELTIDRAGRLSFRFDDGRALLIDLTIPTQALRIIDYRSTTAGMSDGAPAVAAPTKRRLPITGPACDEILEIARARGIRVSASSLPTASMTGRPLGKAVVWDLNPGTGVAGRWRRNS